ncbi:MAG: phosphotransferase [Gaiellaceae bacterium]
MDERRLIDFVTAQRWFGSKTREVTHARVLDRAALRAAEPELAVALVEIGFDSGTHETYQLMVGGDELDALEDPRRVRELVHMIRGGMTITAGEGTVEFRPVEGCAGLGTDLTHARPIGTEQSNSSIVFDEELILKVFRRLEPGINPELELLRFLTDRGFPNIAALCGWYAYAGGPTNATLGILQRYVDEGEDGWELALGELGEAPERFLVRLRRLGEVTGLMHTTLGSDSNDANFSPETPSAESLGLLTATVDEQIEQIFLTLPQGDDAVAPIAGRGEEVREQLRMLTHAGSVGKLIRTHGDFHLGQTLWHAGDWVILDFEGEPARPLSERRRKRSPLRDVAGMLRSFAYAISAAELLRGIEAPQGWEDRAREQFLAGYRETVDLGLLPSSIEAINRLLAVFELEKAVYELRYELDNRPQWVRIPVAGIQRLIEEGTRA